jgi:hypothetical protein
MPQPSESGRWLRRIHLGFAGLAVLLFVAIGIVASVDDRSALSDPPSSAPTIELPTLEVPDPAPDVPEPVRIELAQPFDLGVGQCFDIAMIAGEIADVIPRLCYAEHEFEVYSSEVLTQVGYPDVYQLDSHYNVYCIADFQIYMGAPWREDAAVGFFGIIPSVEAWRAGDRSVECVVYHLTEPRQTRTLRNTGIDGRH